MIYRILPLFLLLVQTGYGQSSTTHCRNDFSGGITCRTEEERPIYRPQPLPTPPTVYVPPPVNYFDSLRDAGEANLKRRQFETEQKMRELQLLQMQQQMKQPMSDGQLMQQAAFLIRAQTVAMQEQQKTIEQLKQTIAELEVKVKPCGK